MELFNKPLFADESWLLLFDDEVIVVVFTGFGGESVIDCGLCTDRLSKSSSVITIKIKINLHKN